MLHFPAFWNAFNLNLYMHWAATSSAPRVGVDIALLLAKDAIVAVPLLLVWGWLRRPEALRLQLLQAAFAALLALGINQLIGLVVFEPRPFAIGLGPALLPHAPDSSFPSDHLTLIWAVAASLMLCAPWRRAGLLLVLLGLPVAWARVYLGVHWPLDMMGAALVGLAAALLTHRAGQRVLAAAMPLFTRVYRKLFAPAIRHGWAIR
ncbi:MAG: undecaprenyl-diphosphatase [Thiomonas sp.]